MKKHNILILAVSALLLASCGYSSPIERYSESKSHFRKGVPLMSHNYPDKDLYRVYMRAATGFVTIGSIRADTEERAEKFCERQGKGMVILGEKTSPAPHILGNFPRIEIVFAAVPKPR